MPHGVATAAHHHPHHHRHQHPHPHGGPPIAGAADKIYHNIPSHGGDEGKDEDGVSCKNNNSIYANRNVDDVESGRKRKSVADGATAGDDEEDVEEEVEEEEEEEESEDESGNRNSNETRTLTQQSRLVAPSEVTMNMNQAFIAEPVVTPSGKCTQTALVWIVL